MPGRHMWWVEATLRTASRTSNVKEVAGLQPISALCDSADNNSIDVWYSVNQQL